MILDGPGGTIPVNDVPLPTHGYFVGGSKPRAQFIGWWKDYVTGKIHLDWVDHYADRAMAMEVGRLRGEIAIFDVVADAEIRLT